MSPVAISQKYLNEGEQVLVSTRTHVKALIGPVLLLLLTMVVAAFLGLSTPSGTVGTVLRIVIGVVTAVVVIWWVLRPTIRWATTTYTFTDRRFFTRTGFIATEGRTIPLNRVSGVDFEIDVLDRLFGCGTLIVTDASAEGRVLVHDIPQVERVHLLVAEELHRRATRSEDGA